MITPDAKVKSPRESPEPVCMQGLVVIHEYLVGSRYLGSWWSQSMYTRLGFQATRRGEFSLPIRRPQG